jgi:type IV pilus assembly protein PilA
MVTRNEKGFTLIELMIVIAIIGILAAIAIPQFNAYRARSYNASAVSDLRNIETACEAYYVDYNNYPPTGSDPVAGAANLTQSYGYSPSKGVTGAIITRNADGDEPAYTIGAIYNTLAATAARNSYSFRSGGTGIESAQP